MATAPTSDPIRDEDEVSRAKPPFLRRVRIRNYKSIAFCDVTLEPLTILVGKNGAGKSNFLDAIAFLRDIMELGLKKAVVFRGNWSVLCHRPSGKRIEIGVELELDDGQEAHYQIVLGANSNGVPRIEEETGPRLNRKNDILFPAIGDVTNVTVLSPDQSAIYFVTPEVWRPVQFHLLAMTHYNFNPRMIRQFSFQNRDEFLFPDGSNLPSVIETTKEAEPWLVDRIRQFLSAVVPEIERFDTEQIGDAYETVRFWTAQQPEPFYASSMSDGTLRVLAALVAAYQKIPSSDFPSVVAIEEPETALHPAAMRALVGAFDEATLRTQILLTTHSPDLLDTEKIRPENVRVVEMRNGSTWITPVDEASASMVRDGLSTLGGLERDRQLELNQDDFDRQVEMAKESGR